MFLNELSIHVHILLLSKTKAYIFEIRQKIQFAETFEARNFLKALKYKNELSECHDIFKFPFYNTEELFDTKLDPTRSLNAIARIKTKGREGNFSLLPPKKKLLVC